jgi:hypothetical protein
MTLERRTEEINSRAPCSAQAGKTLQHLLTGKASSAKFRPDRLKLVTKR